MLRISKLTDYGIVLLAHFAELGEGETQNARELSEATSLPFPVVGKILKSLTQEGLLASHRGAKGGYSLTRSPASVSVAEIIQALEGPIALMACSAGPGHCGQEHTCRVREPWQRIHSAIQSTLVDVSLASLVGSDPPGILAPPTALDGADRSRNV
jgi:FeS assembly SUF system regulator